MQKLLMFLFFIPTLKAFETPAPPAGDGDGAADVPDEFASADHETPAAAAVEAEGGADEESKAPPAFYAHAGKYFLVVYSCTTFMRMYVTSSNIVAELKRRAIQAVLDLDEDPRKAAQRRPKTD